MTRDLTRQQFERRLEQFGLELLPFGYAKRVDSNTEHYRFNGGDRYRDQLAYLLKVTANESRP